MYLPEHPESADIVQSFFLFLRLNVRTLMMLLQLLRAELERSLTMDSQVHDSQSGLGIEIGKLTAVVRRVLPGLRHYSSWLLYNAPILAAGVGDAVLMDHVRELWIIYARVLTLLVSSFPVSGLPPPVEYLLEEDEDTVDFKPFMNDETQRRFYSEDTGSQKPRWHDQGVDRHHPDIEMLSRIRGLLTDGMDLHSQEVLSSSFLERRS